MFSKLFSKHEDVPMPELSFQEQEQLFATLNEAGKAHHTSFSRFEGVLMALLATKNAPLDELWALSDYPHAPPELREQAAPYIRSTSDLMAAGYLSPKIQNAESAQNFREWLSGVGDVLGLKPERAMVLVSYPDADVSAPTIMALMLARKNTFLHADAKSRRDVLDGLQDMDNNDRARMLMDYPGDLMSLYGDPNMEAVSQQQFSGPGVARVSASSQPVRREGKKILPNAPCPCGSGKKYKKCCGAVKSG